MGSGSAKATGIGSMEYIRASAAGGPRRDAVADVDAIGEGDGQGLGEGDGLGLVEGGGLGHGEDGGLELGEGDGPELGEGGGHGRCGGRCVVVGAGDGLGSAGAMGIGSMEYTRAPAAGGTRRDVVAEVDVIGSSVSMGPSCL